MNETTRPDGTLADLDGHTHGGRYHSHIGGGQPHDHTEPPRPPRRGGATAGFVLAGLGLLGLILPWLPFGGATYSIAQANGICNSGIGHLAQALSPADAQNCGYIGFASGACWVVVAAGVGIAGWCLWRDYGRAGR